MNWFDKIKQYYKNGLWDKRRVSAVVGKVLTEQEYEDITGEEYPTDTYSEQSAQQRKR